MDLCKAVTTRGTLCSYKAIKDGYCARHQPPQPQRDPLEEEMEAMSRNEIVIYVRNATGGRVELDGKMPHHVLMAQAMEYLS